MTLLTLLAGLEHMQVGEVTKLRWKFNMATAISWNWDRSKQTKWYGKVLKKVEISTNPFSKPFL